MTDAQRHRLNDRLARARLTMAFINIGELISKFDPGQPRVPAGVSTGGQWVGTNRLRIAGKWNERRRDVCEAQYELDMFQCRMTLWNPFCADQARSRMTACMKGDPIPPFFHIGDS